MLSLAVLFLPEVVKECDDNFETTLQVVQRRHDDRFERTEGARATYMHQEELESRFGKTKAQTYVRNCKQLVRKGKTEMIQDDEMFGCKTYLLSTTASLQPHACVCLKIAFHHDIQCLVPPTPPCPRQVIDALQTVTDGKSVIENLVPKRARHVTATQVASVLVAAPMQPLR